MPVSRPTPPYLQSPWHPPTTTQTSQTQPAPHSSVATQPSSQLQYYSEQQLILVPTVKTRKVRKPLTVWREEEVVEEEDESDEERNGTEHKVAEQPRAQQQIPAWGSGLYAGESGRGSGDAEEKHNVDVVLDIDDSPLSPAASLSSSLFSLVQPLTSFSIPSSLAASSPSSPPSAASAALSRYNPRIINGYIDRRRPLSRKLLAVPNESLPPPPFVPPTYPLSTRKTAAASQLEEKENESYQAADTASADSAAHQLTIDLSSLTPSPSTSTFLSALPSHLSSSSSSAESQWSDPTSLASCGLELRDNVMLPRGSPRALSQGCVVYDVTETSRAWNAGIRSGDAIVSVEGREVRNEEECVRCVNRICGKVRLRVRRDGELVDLFM